MEPEKTLAEEIIQKNRLFYAKQKLKSKVLLS